MSNYSSSNSFITFDLGLTTALVCSGFLLDHLDKSIPTKVAFHFQKTSPLDQFVQLYWSGQLDVKALTYFNTLKMLKNRIYSE